MKGVPQILDTLNCGNNKLTSLKHCPNDIKNGLSFLNNYLTLDSLKDLNLVKIKGNYICLEDNKELGELQIIQDFNELKKILTIYQEKENINYFLNNKNFNNTTQIINKI